MPNNSTHKEVYGALLCGARLTSSDLRQKFVELGLYHLFVVSGLHVQVLTKNLLNPLLTRNESTHRYLLPLGLILYCAVCDYSAPTCRATLAVVWGLWMPKIHKQWPPASSSAAISLTLLMIHPHWSQELGFYLSWIAHLGIHAPLKSALLRNLLIYICLSIPLSSLQIASPITVLIGTLFTPVITNFMLPMTFLTTLIHPLLKLSDSIWNLLISLFYTIPTSSLVLPFEFQVKNKFLLFIYAAVTNLGIWFWQSKVLRSQWQK